MKNLLCFIALLGFVAFTLGQLDLGDAGKFTHFTAGNFRRSGWQQSGNINAWDTSSSRFNAAGGADWTGNVYDVAPAGTNGLLAVGDFTAVNGKTAIGIAYYNGTTWCGFPHLNLFRYTRTDGDLTSFPRPLATANGAAYAVYKNGNDYYILGGRTASLTPSFNMIGTSVRTGAAGLLKITFSNNNFTVDTTSFTYQVRPTGDTTNPGAGYPAGRSSAPLGDASTKLRVIFDGSTPVFFAQTGTQDLRFWRDTYNDWVRLSQASQSLLVSGTSQTFTIPTGIPYSNGTVSNFEVTGSVVFVYGTFNNSNSGVTDQQWVNIAKLTYSNTMSFSYSRAYTVPSQLSTNNVGNPGVSALALVSETNFYFASGEVVQYASPNSVTNQEQRFFVYQWNNNAVSIVGGSTSNRFLNSGATTTNPVSRLWVIGGNIQAYGTFNLYNFNYEATLRSNTRFTESASGWAQFSNGAWSVVYGGGVLNGATQVTPLKVVESGTWVYFLLNTASASFNSYDVYSNGLVGFDDRKNTKKYRAFTYARVTTRDGVGSPLPLGGDGTIRAVHFLKSQRSGVDDAVLIGGQFDWIGTTLLGSVAFLRARTSTYESVGGGLWTIDNVLAFTGDANVPQFVAGKVNDFEERSNRLYAAGIFSKNSNGDCLSNVARLNFKDTNAVWTSLGSEGCNGEVNDLLVDGDDIYAGGSFDVCGNKRGTRNIAYFDEDDEEWKPLNTGLNGAVRAMIKYRGKIYVGGDFSSASNIRTGTSNGLARWDGEHWDNVLSRCQVDCQVGEFEFPFVSQTDPVSRTSGRVSSFKVTGGKLYAHGALPASPTGTRYLLQYDGSTWRQLGIAQSASACEKQGCLATNQSEIIAVGFSNAAQAGYNPNYQEYDTKNNVWEETYEGFDSTIITISASSSVTFSVVLLFIASIIVIFF